MRLLGGDLLGGVDRQLRADLVDVVHDVLHAIVRLRDGGAGEGVGLADIGAALEVTPMDLADRVGLREHEEVVVALELLR